MSTELSVAPVQFDLRAEPTLESFLAHVESAVDGAARAGAEVVVLPELVSTGLLATHPSAGELTVADLGDAYRAVFPQYEEAYAEQLRALARAKGVWIAGGSHWRLADDGGCRNTAFLAEPDGQLHTQDKLHLTPPEKAIGGVGGDRVLIASIGSVRVAILICADIEFPELTRHCVTHGVELLLCPSLTWNTRGANRVRVSSIARALENQLFVAMAPMIGSCGLPREGALHCKGQAFVACPIDRLFGRSDGVLAITERPEEEAAIVARLDFDQLAESRANPEPPGLSNRRPELYASLEQVTDDVASAAAHGGR
jgi:predicted amidohydrolase